MSLGPLAIAVRNGKLALESHPLDRDPAAVERAAFILHEWLRPGEDTPANRAHRKTLELYAKSMPTLLEAARETLEQLEAQLCEWRQDEVYAELERKGKPNPRPFRINPVRANEYRGYATDRLGGPMTDHQREQADEVLERLYRQLYDMMHRVYPMTPRQPPDLIIDSKARTTERSFAFFQFDESDASREHCSVHVSPLLGADAAHAEGVIAHELGHYCDYFLGSKTRRGEEILRQRIRDDKGYPYAAAGWPLPSSPERLADAIAESFLERPVYYSADCLVQSTDPNHAEGVIRPRPRGLG